MYPDIYLAGKICLHKHTPLIAIFINLRYLLTGRSIQEGFGIMVREKKDLVRVTINLDEVLIIRLKEIQAYIIKETHMSYSFSKVIAEILDLGLEDRKLSDVLKILVEEAKLK